MPRTAHGKPPEKSTHRLSVSLSAEDHVQLAQIADKNKVSIAWVVREAVERLLRDELPLFHVRRPQ
jgi:hypothetical protein